MKLTEREKNLILVLLGVLLLVSTYYFGYRTLKADTETLKKQNENLSVQIATLEEMQQYREVYQEESAKLSSSVEEIIKRFPAGVKAEDMVLTMQGIESKTKAYVSSITTPGMQSVELAYGQEKNVLESMEDVTGVIAANSFVNDGSVPDTYHMLLSYARSGVNYTISYDGLKAMLKELTGSENRKSIDNISLVFDENTGNLSGTMSVNYFALSGTGKEYIQPKIQGTSHGIDCIFGNLRTRGITIGNEEAAAE